MRTPFIGRRVMLFSALLLVISSPHGLAAFEIGSGPAVGRDFDVVAFPSTAGGEALFVAWRGASSNVPSGVLRLDDGPFTPFPTISNNYLTNLNVGVGGPAADRRAYVTWVGSQLELVLASFDAAGTLVSPAQSVASSVQITPNRLAGTDAGVLVGHSWDTNPYWDPRVLEVDVAGNVVGLEVAENVAVPEQTLGTAVAAEPGGDHAIVYTTSDTRQVRLRRYGAGGAIDPAPVLVSGDVTSDYVPHAALFLGATVPSTMLMAFPYLPAGASPDVRFALAPLSSGPVALGPRLSQLVPGFLGGITDLEALRGTSLRAVVTWQEIELEDPNTCGCSVPPPVRIDFFAQVLDLGPSIVAEGPPLLIYRWKTGDPIGPPITGPRVVASDEPGSFSVVWSDGILRYTNIDTDAVGVEPVGNATVSSLASHPNPFSERTTLSYSVARPGPVRLTIMDVRGREIVSLVDAGRSEGLASIGWDGRNGQGMRVPAGVYFARFETREGIEAAKLALVR